MSSLNPDLLLMKTILPLIVTIAALTACKPAQSTTTTAVSPDGTTVTKTTTTTTAPDAPVVPAPTLTQANLDRVSTDMSKAEVEAIFGAPTSSNAEPIPIVGGEQTTYNYQSGSSAVTIVFKNDKVKEKHGTFNP
jgi:hypothetical protein